MRVYIGPYTHWFGPYQLAELLCFWVKRNKFGEEPDYVHKFGEWLAYGSVKPEANVGEITSLKETRNITYLYRFLLWLDSKKKREINVSIDDWDTWSADYTLGYIILPVLKKIKKDSTSVPNIENEDVPEHLRNEEHWDKKKWDWVLDEMIWTFEQIILDCPPDFSTGEVEIKSKKLENGYYEMIFDGDYKVDREAEKEYNDRITNGLLLFGKYYRSLWT